MTELEALKDIFDTAEAFGPDDISEALDKVRGLIARIEDTDTDHDKKTDVLFSLFAEHMECVPVEFVDLEEYQTAFETSGLVPAELVLDDVVSAILAAVDQVPQPDNQAYHLAVRSKTIQLLKEGGAQ